MVVAHAYPKTVRLLNSTDFTGVFKQAELNICSGPLRLRAIRNRMPSARLGVVVSKKGNSRAVRRNRIKRLIRERFRLTLSKLPEVDIALQVFAQIDDDELVRRVDDLFVQVRARIHD